MKIPEGTQKEIARFPGDPDIDLSPDGRWLAATNYVWLSRKAGAETYRQDVSVTVRNVATGVQRVFPDAGMGTWSPDNRYLWTRKLAEDLSIEEFHILDLPTLREVRTLASSALPPAGRQGFRVGLPQFSPDGQQAALEVFCESGYDSFASRSILYLTRSDGSGLHSFGELQSKPRSFISDDSVVGWTSDGDLVTFNGPAGTVTRLNPRTGARRVIYSPPA
jgi:hypothetical protein